MTHETDVEDAIDVDDDTLDATPETTALTRAHDRGDLRHGVPTSLDEHIAAYRENAIAQIETRAVILNTVVVSLLRATFPSDYVATRAPDGQVTLYLQGKGCARVRKHLGISIRNPRIERVETGDPDLFYYLSTVDGWCRFTREKIRDVEAGSATTDEVCKGVAGVARELLMRKTARTRADGRATRILAGIDGLPAEYLDEVVWKDTSRRSAQCPKGKGFGSRDERLGAAPANAPDVEPPVCPHCKAKGVYRPARTDQQGKLRAAFYGCPNYSKHKDQKFIVDAADWISKHPPKGLTPSQAAGFTGEPTAAPKQKITAPPVGEVFKGSREPGEDDE